VNSKHASVRTAPVARARPGTARIAAAGGLVLLLSIIRPWGDGSPSARAPTETAAVAVSVAEPTPMPAPTRSPGPYDIACPSSGWQIVSLDRLANWTVRTWTPATPVSVSGPLDGTVPEVVLDSPAVLALGVCAPAATWTGSPVAGTRTAVVHAWRDEGLALQPVALDASGLASDDAALATLYRPSGLADRLDAWPSGRFVLEVRRDGDSASSDGWRAAGRSSAPAAWLIAIVVPGTR
jgi:hypothetical protein